MAKKVKNSKKHQLKYSQPTSTSGVGAADAVGAAGKAAVSTYRDFGYVAKDVRRLSFFAAALLAVELVLWYVLGHTGIGNAVYGLIKI